MSEEPIYLYDRHGLNWPTVVVLVLLHIGAIGALFVFNWKAFAVAVFLYWVATGLGISMGYHRLHTHRSYQVRSEEHTSELQSLRHLVCRLLLEKKRQHICYHSCCVRPGRHVGIYTRLWCS